MSYFTTKMARDIPNIVLRSIKYFIHSKKLVFAFFLSILGFFCINYLYATIKYPSFFFSDQFSHFYPIVGLQKIFFPSVAGRFTPLAMVEFYPILISGMPLEKIMQFMYYLQALKIFFVFIFLFLSMRMISTSFIALTLSFLFCVMAQQVDFYQVIALTQASETIVSLLFLIFFLLYIAAQKKNSSLLYLFCFILVFISSYYKEPVFGTFLVFAFFQYINFSSPKTINEKMFLISLLVNGFIFCVLYYNFAYISGPTYATGRVALSTKDLIISIFQGMPLYYIAIVILIIRCIVFFQQKKIQIQLPDTLLLCVLSWVGAYVILHLNINYYFIPSYIILFLAFAGYLNQLQIYLYEHFPKTYHSFIAVCTFSIIICIFIFPKISSKFDDILYNKRRILTFPTLAFLHDLEQLQHKRYNFLPPSHEFEIPFQRKIASWHERVVESFYNMYYHKPLPLPQETGIFNSYYGSEFMDKLDQGGIGQFAPIATFQPFPWQNNTQYSQINLDFINIVYNKAIEKDINTAFCKMIRTISDSTSTEFSKFFPDLEGQASFRGCIQNNGLPFTPASLKNMQELSSIQKALARYHEEQGEYPISVGFQGYNSRYGASKGKNWIDGLVPQYLSELPYDSNCLTDSTQGYLYMSDGNDYKLIAHQPQNLTLILQLRPEWADPMRPNWAAGFWTDGARNW